jgi:hypothetical protein
MKILSKLMLVGVIGCMPIALGADPVAGANDAAVQRIIHSSRINAVLKHNIKETMFGISESGVVQQVKKPNHAAAAFVPVALPNTTLVNDGLRGYIAHLIGGNKELQECIVFAAEGLILSRPDPLAVVTPEEVNRILPPGLHNREVLASKVMDGINVIIQISGEVFNFENAIIQFPINMTINTKITIQALLAAAKSQYPNGIPNNVPGAGNGVIDINQTSANIDQILQHCHGDPQFMNTLREKNILLRHDGSVDISPEFIRSFELLKNSFDTIEEVNEKITVKK